jgi:hypothetical protein
MCICIYIYIYIYVCIYIYMYIYIHIYIHPDSGTYWYGDSRFYISNAHLGWWVYICICVCICNIYVYICMSVYLYIYIYIYIYINTCKVYINITYTSLYRKYTWSLSGTFYKGRSIIISGIFNIVLASLIITVYIHRKDVEIRMFHYLHISLICLSTMVFCWGNVLLYQVYMYVYVEICICVCLIYIYEKNSFFSYMYIWIFTYLYFWIIKCLHIYIFIGRYEH